MKNKVTFDDIAAHTSLSKTTISRYFNNPDSLLEATQQKIADALAELNYQENKVARILANGKTEFIGIIAPNLFFEYYTSVLNSILNTYSEYGYKFIVFLGNDHADEEKKCIDELMAYQIEGLIVLSQTLSSYELSKINIPLVSIEREDEFISSVNTNNYSGGVQAANLLAQHHCDVLIHINNPVNPNTPGYSRTTGFEDTCRRLNFTHQVFLLAFENDYQDYVRKMKELFSKLEQDYPGLKKGIFCSNDVMANALLNTVVRSGKRIPEDYELIGFDNSRMAEQSIIPLTSVSQNVEDIGSRTMEILLSQIGSKKRGRSKQKASFIQHLVVEPELVCRESTGQKQSQPAAF